MLRNTVGSGSVSDFIEKSITKMHGSTLLPVRAAGWMSKKVNVTVEWPPKWEKMLMMYR